MKYLTHVGRTTIVFGFVLLLAVSAFAGGRVNIKLFFVGSSMGGSPPQIVAVERKVDSALNVLDLALKELLKGPTDEEKRMGLSSRFFPGDVADYNTDCQIKRDLKVLKPLRDYYLGVRIGKDGIAVIDFKKDAMCYLENTPANSYEVMEPIRQTATQFKSVKDVQYSIEGKVIEGWDA